MRYRDLDYEFIKTIKSVFRITDYEFAKLAGQGKFVSRSIMGHRRVFIDSLSCFFGERENVVMKKWGYDYEDPREKYERMIHVGFSEYPRMFMRADGVPDGYYRAFYQGKALKVCIYVYEGIARCICYRRSHEEEMVLLFHALDKGEVDIEE